MSKTKNKTDKISVPKAMENDLLFEERKFLQAGQKGGCEVRKEFWVGGAQGKLFFKQGKKM